MTVIGVTVWMTAVLFILCHLLTEEKKRVAEYEGLVLLLHHIRTSVSTYAMPKEQIFAAFSHAPLEKCGFLPLLRQRGLAHALEEGGLRASEEALRPLRLFAKDMGMRLSEEELAACARALDETEPMLASLRSGLPTRLRLCRTLVLTGGMMIVLLFV